MLDLLFDRPWSKKITVDLGLGECRRGDFPDLEDGDFEVLILFGFIPVLHFYWSKLDSGAHLHRNLPGLLGRVYPSLIFFFRP